MYSNFCKKNLPNLFFFLQKTILYDPKLEVVIRVIKSISGQEFQVGSKSSHVFALIFSLF